MNEVFNTLRNSHKHAVVPALPNELASSHDGVRQRSKNMSAWVLDFHTTTVNAVPAATVFVHGYFTALRINYCTNRHTQSTRLPTRNTTHVLNIQVGSNTSALTQASHHERAVIEHSNLSTHPREPQTPNPEDCDELPKFC